MFFAWITDKYTWRTIIRQLSSMKCNRLWIWNFKDPHPNPNQILKAALINILTRDQMTIYNRVQSEPPVSNSALWNILQVSLLLPWVALLGPCCETCGECQEVERLPAIMEAEAEYLKVPRTNLTNHQGGCAQCGGSNEKVSLGLERLPITSEDVPLKVNPGTKRQKCRTNNERGTCSEEELPGARCWHNKLPIDDCLHDASTAKEAYMFN